MKPECMNITKPSKPKRFFEKHVIYADKCTYVAINSVRKSLTL